MDNNYVGSVPLIEIELPGGARGLKGDQGPKGDKGDNYNPIIEEVETLEPTQPATAEVRADDNNIYFSFGIPKGEPGEGTKLSDFDNDVGFVTADTTELENYALISNTYTKTEVDNSLSTKANTSDVTTALATKANTSDVNTALATKVNVSDVIDNLTSTETTKPLSANQGKILNDKISEYVSVKNYGAKGDGISDDTSAIQNCIDNNPNKTIYFPDGTYIVSNTIETSATDNEKVYLVLSENATIKASNSFSDSFVVSLGEKGTAAGYSSTSHKSGIEGGIIDCNSRTSGLLVKNMHLTKVINLSVINSNLIGIQIDKSNNNSSDTYVQNVDLRGIDGNIEETIGLYIIGSDNNIQMVRTTGFHTGIKLSGAGNYLNNCHPLYSIKSSDTNYNTSIAFDINDTDNILSNCYADNFGIGFQQSGNYKWNGTDLFCYWYDDNSSNTHCAIKTKTISFKGKIKGMSISYPSVGDNLGMVVEDQGYTNNIYPLQYMLNEGYEEKYVIKNLSLTRDMWLKMKYKYSDPLLATSIRDTNTYTLRGISDTIDVDKWYPLMFITRMTNITGTFYSDVFDINFKIGRLFSADIMFAIENDVLKTKSIKTIYNPSGISLTFGLGKIDDLNKIYTLYFKINSWGTATNINNYGYTVTIKEPSQDNLTFILPRNSIYQDPSLNGITTIPNALTGGRTIQNKNIENGIFERRDWAANHEVKAYDATEGRSAFIFFIRWNTSVGVYAWFYEKFIPLNTDNVSSGDSVNYNYNSSSGVLTITCNTNSLMCYAKF